MSLRRGVVSVGLGVVLLVSGCTTSAVGQAQPAPGQGGASSTTGSSTAAATSLPPRLAELSVAGIDPCALLPEGQRASLEIDRPPNKGDGGGDALIGGTACTYPVTTWGVYGVVVSSTFTVTNWIEQTGGQAKDNRVTSVGGYPAVVTYSSDQSGSCFVLVDVAVDSVLYVPVTDRRDYVVQDGKVVCANAKKAAGVALTTLQALQK